MGAIFLRVDKTDISFSRSIHSAFVMFSGLSAGMTLQICTVSVTVSLFVLHYGDPLRYFDGMLKAKVILDNVESDGVNFFLSICFTQNE